MEKMRENLVRLQELQLKAFDSGLNMELSTRSVDGDPWIIGHIKEEGTSFFAKDEFFRFECYSFWEDETNAAKIEAAERFIKEHRIIRKYGEQWKPVSEDPRTENSWLVVTIGEDQIFVDEVEGKRILVTGGENPMFSVSSI